MKSSDSQNMAVAALVADWVTIWQSEMAALATDREAAEQMGMILVAWFTARTAPPHRESSVTSGTATGADVPARPAPAAAASAAGDSLAALERRLAELERRVAAAAPAG